MPPSLNFASSKVITILVGPMKKSYTLHQDLLCAHSPFFEKCLKGNFAEKHTDRVELPEDSPDVFEHFVHWIYREDFSEPTDEASVELAIHTYVLADKLCMPAFKNRVVTRIRTYYRSNAVPLDSVVLWRSLEVPDTLPLGRFLYDQVGYDMVRHPRKYFLRSNGSARRGDVDALAEDNGPLVAELLWAVLQATNRTKNDDPARREGCHYHEHAEGEAAAAAAAVSCPDAVPVAPATTSRKKEKRPSMGATSSSSHDDLGPLLRGLGLAFRSEMQRRGSARDG